MKLQKVILSIIAVFVLIIGILYFFSYQSSKKSVDCSQFVIDSYEVHSGIDIPKVDFINCYYDKSKGVRISIYRLLKPINTAKFRTVDLHEALSVLQGKELLNEAETPNSENLLVAAGEKYGRKWVYLFDSSSSTLWAVLATDREADERGLEMNIGNSIKPLGESGIFRDSSYFNWGSSIIKGEDNLYHLFYSRWPRELSFYAWLTHSEIAHAVSENAAGPYVYKETVLSGRGGNHWDAITAHNPKIKRFNGKYYIYYIGTNSGEDSLNQKDLIETAKTGYKHSNWSTLRNNQRTGVAVSNSLNGPWTRAIAPIVEPEGPITTLTVNPAIAKGADSLYYLIVKGDKPNETRFIRNQAISVSTVPTGPFEIQNKPVIDNLDTEDVSMWHSRSDRMFYAVFHAHTFIGLMESKDGLNWQKAPNYTIMEKQIELTNGSYLQPDRMERPFILVENGVPSVLSLAVKKGEDSFSVFIELEK